MLVTVLTLLLVGGVGAGVVAVSVVRADREAEATDAERRRDAEISAGPTDTTTPAATRLDWACSEMVNGEAVADSRPAQPAPVPGQPGQHVIVLNGTDVEGNLDLAPGGGWQEGHSAASDAKTVFVACIREGESQPTGEMCDYIPDDGGPMWTVELHVRTMVVVVTEARSDTEIGRSAPIPGPNGGCPAVAFQQADGSIGGGDPTDVDAAVAWLRDHLTGAVFTP